MADAVFTNSVPRDKWDRPGILQPNGKHKWYRRTTTFISNLEDTYSLQEWSQRMVALGMGQREDLVLSAASLTADKSDRAALDNVAKAAKEHAMASSKATKGTAIHKICQRIDEGENINNIAIPSKHVDDVKAYIALRDSLGIQWGLIECMRVYDPWQVAGTPDRTGCIGGKWYIIDLKTGDIDFENTRREIAQQLAMYSRSTPYDPDQVNRPGFKNGRFPDPSIVDRHKAVVLHVPAGAGQATAHWVDIDKGWEGIMVSKRVWDWRKITGTFQDFELADDGGLTPTVGQNSYAELALQAADEEELRVLWSQAAAKIALTPDFKLAVQTRLAQLKGELP